MSLFTEQKINIAASDVAPIQTLAVAGNASIAGTASVGSTLSVVGSVQSGAITSSGSIKSSAGAAAASSGVGYATGAGAAIVQGTSRATAVIINALSGAITLFAAANVPGAFSFTVTNSAVAATDVIIVSQKSGTDKYTQDVTAVANGSFQLTLNSAGTTNEAPVFNFAVIKAVAA